MKSLIDSPSSIPPRFTWLCCFAVFGLAIIPSTQAANIWDGGGGNGNWSTAANWDNNVVPANSQSLTFGGTLQLNSVNDVGAINAVSGLTFASDAGAFTLSGNALNLGGNISNNSSNTQTIANNLTLANVRTVQGGAAVTLSGTLTNSGSNRELINNLTAGTLTIGNINLSESATSRGLTLTSNGTSVVNGVIANGGGSTAGFFVTRGTGQTYLTQANTFGGGTTVQGGELILDFSGAGAPTTNILYNGVTANSVTLNTVGSGVAAALTTTIKGANSTNNAQTISSLNLGASGLDRGVAGHLNLQAGSNGTVSLTISGASNPLNLFRGSTLDIAKAAGDTVTITNGANINGVLGGGTNAGVSTIVTLNGTDWASLDGSKTVVAATYTTSFTVNSTVNLNVQSSGNLTGSAVNTLRFHQSAANTVTASTANTTVNGVLVTSAVGANQSTITGQSIRGTNNQSLAIFQNNTAADLRINSVIESQGTSGLIKAGLGRAVLGATNTYTGATFVNEGTLVVEGSTSTGIVYVARDARLGGNGTVNGATLVSTGGIIQAGNGVSAAGALTFSGNLTMGDDSRIVLTLGPSLAHSTLLRTGGIWSFDGNQAFTLNLAGAAAGVYDNVISGLTGSEAGLSTIGSWIISNPGAVGAFSYNGSGGVDLNLSVIPEPSTYLLFGASVLWILFVAGRRFRRA